ncbi:ABC transporter substrate-binding protein [Natrarchaeobius sp. A-rgal3]|uniref:ABC transporter substrate-binding protein n=1 Tax=Natrarchaeobius versutus TaxID=1679078 RepID=UPI00350FC724
MPRQKKVTKGVTRRKCVRYGGTVLGGGLLAGCTDGESRSVDEQTDRSDEACIEPVGCRTFEEVPKTWMAPVGTWADMAIALGQRDGFLPAGWYAPSYLYERVGIEMPAEISDPLSGTGWDKELFYELDPDVILCDPNYLHTGFPGWDESDTQELDDNVAPFFGRVIFRDFDFPVYQEYDQYTLYEAFDRLATLFRERERYDAFVAVHDGLVTAIDAKLPAEHDRPEVGLVNFSSDPAHGEFSALTIDETGTEMKHVRDLGVRSAFTEAETDGTLDYEKLLEIDPETIIVHSAIQLTDDDGEFSASTFHDEFVAPMANHPVGSQLTAVENGNVYPGGHYLQGPIANLFQTELTARQLFPDEFGAFDPDRFPDVPADQQLFDRQRVADIINGEF